MKHSWKITSILLGMFIICQLIGIAVISSYSPQTETVIINNVSMNKTTYNLPSAFEPPEQGEKQNAWSLFLNMVFAFAIVIFIYLLLMKFGMAKFMQIWFLIVIGIAVGISLNAGLRFVTAYAVLISFIAGFLISILKTFRRNVFVHNISELLIYPGIAAMFVALIVSYASAPILVISLFLIGISVYDIYAVWHSQVMQKMAKYQIEKVKVFAGFFIPYINKEERERLDKLKLKMKNKDRKIKVKASLAILGGGDVVWPMILSGIVYNVFGLMGALIIVAGAVLSLGTLFYLGKKGKFYPAMPFISGGCFIALGLVYLII
jgi:hypothetical protein